MSLLKDKLNLAVCISGEGSTLLEILKACKDHRLSRVNPALIITNNPKAGGIKKAHSLGFPEKDIRLILRKGSSEPQFGAYILSECHSRRIDLIAMCGFLSIMPKVVTDHYVRRIFNQHPGPVDGSKLGFGGKKMHGLAVHQAVLNFATNINRPFATCATTHFATEEVDEGALIGIRPVAIFPSDTAKTLAARVLPEEHGLVIETIFRFSECGEMQGFSRANPIVEPGEEPILEAAKAAAIKQYPNG